MSHTLAMGGLGALGIIGMPLMIAAMLLKQPPGPVAKLIAAKATSPERARRLDKIGVPRQYLIEPAVRRGVAHRTEDGRYWVDEARNRVFRRRVASLAGLAAVGAGIVLWWIVDLALGATEAVG